MLDIWSFVVDVISSGVQACILIVMFAVFLQTSRWNFKKHVTDQLTIYSSHVQQFRIDSLIKSEIKSNSNAERDLDIDNFYGRRAIAYYSVKFAGLLVRVKNNQKNIATLSAQFFRYFGELRVIYSGLARLMVDIKEKKIFFPHEKTRMFKDIQSHLTDFEIAILAFYIFQHSEKETLQKVFDIYGFSKFVNTDIDFICFNFSGDFGNWILDLPKNAKDYILNDLEYSPGGFENHFCDPKTETSDLILFLNEMTQSRWEKEDRDIRV